MGQLDDVLLDALLSIRDPGAALPLPLRRRLPLHRTSAEIRYAGGVYPPQDPAGKPIIGGLLAARSEWTDLEGRAATRAIASADPNQQLDLGLALDAKAFESLRPSGELIYSAEGTQLIWFALRLFRRLQRVGTALAIDLDEYEQALG